MRRVRGQTIGYLSILAGSFLLAMAAGWLGTQIDNYAYDWMFRSYRPPPWQPQSILLTADEASLAETGGMRHLRRSLAEALERAVAGRPKAVAIDVILADESDPSDDAALEAAFRKIPNLVLSCELVEEGRRWEDPLPRFRRWAAAVGHVHGDPGPLDGVSRLVPLEKASPRDRRWALALEAFRLSRNVDAVVESPDDLQVGRLRIPARRSDSRFLRIRYLPPPSEDSFALPRISFKQLKENPALAAQFQDKVVFVGITAQSAMRDRLMTPYSHGQFMPGIEIHANIFETLSQGQFLTSARLLAVAGLCLVLAAAGVSVFAFRSGWQAYALAAVVLMAAHVVPYLLFTRNVVLPYFAPVSSAWLSVVGAAAFHFLAVRRQLRRSESEKARYQQAMHFVSHEMRTPLTAIQGSSELMSRYTLSEDKRRQIADLINSESKRLARMIETFLNVERLSAGEMELKREVFQAQDILAGCIERTRPLADRKQIRVRLEPIPQASLIGDRELMEYAIYNLLTNAVKYSPAETEVTVSARRDDGRLRLSVKDQGIGMDRHEVRKIFQRFYRTRKAEASGETGTGIGLSIVEQIVTHHGGKIEVTSAPGKGSCFTLVLPAQEEFAPRRQDLAKAAKKHIE
jgi:signal transduction histidine kinase